MMEITNVKPSSVRKYLYEYVLICLTGCVVFLFLSFNSLNHFIRTELMNQRNELIKTVEQNTNTIKEFINFQKQNTNGNSFKPLAGNWYRNRNNITVIPVKEKLFPGSQYFEATTYDKYNLQP